MTSEAPAKKSKPSKKQRKRAKENAEQQENGGELIEDVQMEDLHNEGEENEMMETNKEESEEPRTHYPIVGNERMVENKRITVVAQWMKHSIDIQQDMNANLTGIQSVTLNHNLTNILRQQGIQHWFPVQTVLIPHLLQQWSPLPPRDVCVSAPTGSGKTLCYVLPIIQRLTTRLVPRIRALVMLPVQDLASQVYEVFKTYARDSGLHILLMTGQHSMQTETNTIQSEMVDILIATPGRLLDHLWTEEGVDLSDLEYLVVDEADGMLSAGDLEWLHLLIAKHRSHVASAAVGVNNLLKAGQRPLHKILLSATLSQDPEQMQQFALFQPKLFKVTASACTEVVEYDKRVAMPEGLTQNMIVSENNRKPLAVFIYLLNNPKLIKVLCFVPTAEASQRLCTVLKHLMGPNVAAECSKNLLRKRREKNLQSFRDGKLRILFCSDLVARGIDLEGVDCVMNYSNPNHLKTYIHRAGRTARAGKSGRVVTLVDSAQKPYFDKMLEEGEILEDVKELEIAKEDMKKHSEKYREALKLLKQSAVDEKKVKMQRTRRFRPNPRFRRK